MPDLDAQYFDQWYADLVASPRQTALQQQTLGLPPELESTSLLPWSGIADVLDALAIGPGEVLVDLACGRGGYGLELARRRGAHLVGVDFSAVAVERARGRSATEWGDVTAEFRTGDLRATGLPVAHADAAVCVDAMQFCVPYAAGLAEARRILRPGGRFVLTGWQAVDLSEPTTSERLRVDIGAEVRAAGFDAVVVQSMAGWRAAERAMWEAAVALDPTGDPALASMRAEGERVLSQWDALTRLMVTARVPA